MKSMKRDWSWTEANDAEFEKRRFHATYYKIFKLGGTKNFPRKDALYKFWAKSRAEALRVLKAYSADHPGQTYYYSDSGYHIDPDGSRHDDLFDMTNDLLRGKKNKEKIREGHRAFVAEKKRIFQALKGALDGLHTRDFSLRVMLDDIRYFIRNYDLRHNASHQRMEQYSMYDAILDLLTFNLPQYFEPKCLATPGGYVEKARKMLGESPSKDSKVSKKVGEKAQELWRAELTKLYEYVMVYRYYSGFGIIDGRNKAENAIDAKYKDTIPYHPGTYKEIDYRKLNKLTETYWNLWTSQYQKIGRCLWK